MGISVNLSGAFLSMYMLKELHLSYLHYTVMIFASQITMFWMMGRWGRNADRSGNMKVVQLTARFLPVTALLWVFSTNPWYLLGVQLVSGVIWAGYNLCVANFVYDSVSTAERVHATALFNTVNGLATFIGAAAGGFLLTRVPAIGGQSFYTLVLIGVAARFAVGWILFPRVREVRKVPRTRSKELVRNLLRLEPAAEPSLS
jgi:predicted MFS family arabinose efflux permease